MIKNRVGEVSYNNFGSKMIIIKYENRSNIDVYFEKYDWIKTNVNYSNFKKGAVMCPYETRVFNIGYYGEGEYNVIENNKQTKEYIHWKSMIERCTNREKYPLYKDCFVCDEWLCFQNFAKWFSQNYYEVENQKMCVDKDILVKNNKIYSPSTCLIVPNNINVLFTNSKGTRGECLLGVDYHKKSNKYRARCSIETEEGYKNITIGFYETELEAFENYKTFKEKHIKDIAEKYKELIPIELYEAMYNFSIDIND